MRKFIFTLFIMMFSIVAIGQMGNIRTQKIDVIVPNSMPELTIDADLDVYGPSEFQDDITMTGTGALKLPVGTDAQRPTPAQGMFRYNTDQANFEGYNGTIWAAIGGGSIFTDAFLTVNDGNTQANADTLGAGLVISMSDATDAALSYDSTTDSFFKMGEIGNQFEVVTTEHAQILENKTLNISEVTNPIRLDAKKDTQANLETYAGAATSGELAYATDTKSYYGIIDNALVDLGGGGGGFNYIENPTPKIDTSGWVRYQTNPFPFGCDKPYDFSLAPSGDFTWTRNTTNALNNVSDFLLTKVAGDRACNGVYTEFDILNGDLSGAMQLLEFAKLDSANYADGDIGIFLVTSSDNFATRNIIYPANEDMLGGTPTVYKQFQFNSTDTKARLVIHIKSSNANAYTVQFNDFKLSKSPVATSAVRVDGKPFTPTGSLTTNVNYFGVESRNGDKLNMTVSIEATGLASPAGTITVNLPPGLTIDTSKLSGAITSGVTPFASSGILNNVGTAFYPLVALYHTDTAIRFRNIDVNSANNVSDATPFTFSTGDSLQITVLDIPIVGWSSNAASSIDLGTRDIKSRAVNSTTTAVGAGSAIHFGNVLESRGGVMWISSTQFVGLETGDYHISGQIAATAAIPTWNITVYNVTDAAVASAGSIGFIHDTTLVTYSGVVPLIKGKTYEIRSSDAFTPVASSMTAVIKKMASPQTMFAGERMSAFVTTTSGQAIANNTLTTIVWNTIIDDSDAAMNVSNGELTIRSNGVFDFSASAGLSSLTVGTGIQFMEIYKNGTRVARGALVSNSDANTSSSVSALGVPCIKDDIITIRIFHTNGVSRNMNTTTGLNTFGYARRN